jgi:hypothetical protein
MASNFGPGASRIAGDGAVNFVNPVQTGIRRQLKFTQIECELAVFDCGLMTECLMTDFNHCGGADNRDAR